MIQFLNVKLKQIAVHHVGNKINDEDIQYSQAHVDLEDDRLIKIFLKYFLSSFSGNEMYQFFNDVGLEQNEIFVLCKRIFDNKSELFSQSKIVAQHLYNSSNHAKIKGGELYVCYFEDVILDNQVTNAIGIFKSENKEEYLRVDVLKKKDLVHYEEGVNISKLDKGCLVFNTNENEGYRVCIIDNLNKSNEAVYWKDTFLGVSPFKNEFHQTNDFLGMAKKFVVKQLSKDFEVTKAEQIDYLNRSVDYFKSHNTFNKEEFEEEVFNDKNVISSFRKFDQVYRDENSLEITDNFSISSQAVKKQAKVFKSVLKLDRNFDIYIHGNSNLIEKGVDEKGRKFYKIYYEEEN